MTQHSRGFLVAGAEDCPIRRVAVIGAGAMGSGIAAQFANAGIGVDLLDIAGADGGRDAAAEAGIARQLKSGGFMHPDAAGLVRPGNIEDHLPRLAEADWIVEAVVERLDVKRALYARIEAVRRKGTIVSSNTSTIPRADLVAEAGADFAAHFLITHFFNPPRVMQLVELVSGAENAPDVIARARQACEVLLGKTAIDCRDTPGFIANRIGCHWLAVGYFEARRLGLTPEEADSVMAALGTPRTGVFGLLDLIGLDLIAPIWGSLIAALPASDDLHRFDLTSDRAVQSLVSAGRFGRKSKAGLYRMAADKSLETYEPETDTYRPARPFDAAALPGGGDLAALFDAGGTYSDYAASVLARVVAYAAGHGPQIASDVGAIDEAMVLGYAWRQGPLQLADSAGIDRLRARITALGLAVPRLLDEAEAGGGFYGKDGSALATEGGRREAPRVAGGLAKAKAGNARICGNGAATLWDLGDGVACLELSTKLNIFSPPVLDVIEEVIGRGGRDFRALVLGNDDPRAFSAGADLGHVGRLAAAGDLVALDAYLGRAQGLFSALKYAPFPVVAAMHGLALGGGCEFGLHADAIVAHAELQAGLPEVLVGLIPGWGGCTQLLLRFQSAPDGARGPGAVAQRVFETIAAGRRSASALDARAMGLLRPHDQIVMNRKHLLPVARQRALALADGYQPPAHAAITVAGPSGKLALMSGVLGARAAGRLTDTDVAVADALAGIVSGGPDGDPLRPATEEDIMRLEREAIMALCRTETSQARIAHMLKTGKPLRN